MTFDQDLIVLHTTCLVLFWFMPGGSVEVCKKNAIKWFLSQTYFDIPRGETMSLALNEPK
jgi:hypothetical protein